MFFLGWLGKFMERIQEGIRSYNDNGTITTIEAGYDTFTPSGTGHGINNTGDEPLDIIALIIYG